MKKGERKKPDIYFDPLARLGPEEKQKLRGLITDPTYLKLMRIIEAFRPSSNVPKAGTGDRDAFSNDRANFRLGEQRGWDLHITAIFAALNDAPQRQTTTEANYPASAAINLEPQLPKS